MQSSRQRGHGCPGPLTAAPILALALAASLGSCRREGAPAAAAPPPFSGALDTVSRMAILAYARGVAYGAEHTGDEQRLMLGSSCPPPGGDCRYGPLVRIEPQSGAHALSQSDLASGRIVARIISRDGAYPKLNLAPRDTVYWWVYRVGDEWRSSLVSSDVKAAIRPRKVVVDSLHPGAPYGQAAARFIWSDRDEGLWASCGQWSCCKSDE